MGTVIILTKGGVENFTTEITETPVEKSIEVIKIIIKILVTGIKVEIIIMPIIIDIVNNYIG